MTPFYLTCYILYTTLTSLFLSLLLALRHLLRRIFTTRASSRTENVVALYEGTVLHFRRLPVHHAFKFAARYALIDLDRPPSTPPHYLSADEARRGVETNGPVLQLWWKNVPFYEHPKYKNPNYRSEAALRDAKIQDCPAFGGIIKKERIDRCFIWKDAEWPFGLGAK
ncbi:hypothetical protein BUALT_Bualt02G0043200 [Buddleja alternifolia]|uniref:Uncharacterized protein n=1 Tax=Buddleja alternifolia TaxID=168488 RepID=A0AAV6XYX8_9LAMI|nr:hypothetical protein BUALT_Bualt02G0043200 [Buddleja alternifolia]